MVKAQQDVPASPIMPIMDVRKGRLRWLAEELCELANAWGIEFDLNNRGGTTDNFAAWDVETPIYTDPITALTEAYDASLDLIVFSVGNAVAMGTELQPGWDEVHSSNMAKFLPGGHKREDGKWQKPPNWQPPKLREIIEAQIETGKSQQCQKPLL